jgi:hypothetical protein
MLCERCLTIGGRSAGRPVVRSGGCCAAADTAAASSAAPASPLSAALLMRSWSSCCSRSSSESVSRSPGKRTLLVGSGDSDGPGVGS